jgi:IPT/TIG domain
VVSSAAGTGTGTVGAPASLTVTGTGFERAGVPDVAGITVGTFEVATFAVGGPTTLTFTLPPGAVQEGAGNTGDGGGTFDVSVTLTGGETSAPTSSARLVIVNDPSGSGASVPVVRAVEPSGGIESGGGQVHIYGSGFAARGGATAVAVGGRAAPFTVVSDTQILATVPAYASGVNGTVCLNGEDPVTDVCQSQVQVRTASGPSLNSAILPEYSGELAPTPATEVMAAPTEFDYLPAPHVSSVVFQPASPAVASESGESVVVINGSGFGQLGLEWVDVGPPQRASSADTEILDLTPTALTIALPGINPTVKPAMRRLAVQTLASPNLAHLASGMEPSNVVPIIYAPQPEVSAISAPRGRPFGPDSGGTRVTVAGTGFEDGPYIEFMDNGFGPSAGTDFDVTQDGTAPGTGLSFVTPPELPGADQVLVCNISGCSGQQSTSPGDPSGPSGDLFTFYPPGAPRLAAISPRTGRAGTMVTITGTNLDEPQAVYFGRRKATQVSNGADPDTDAPEPNVVVAMVPRGAAGRTVNIRVVTAESYMVQKYPKTPVNRGVTFTYSQARKRSPGGPA